MPLTTSTRSIPSGPSMDQRPQALEAARAVNTSAREEVCLALQPRTAAQASIHQYCPDPGLDQWRIGGRSTTHENGLLADLPGPESTIAANRAETGRRIAPQAEPSTSADSRRTSFTTTN